MPISPDKIQQLKSVIERAKAGNIDPAKVQALEMRLNSMVEGYDPGNDSMPEVQDGPTLGGYHYNPTVEQFRKDIKNRALQEKLGLRNLSSSPSAGAAYIQESVPELKNDNIIDQLDKNSPEYKAYSDYVFQQSQSKDPNLTRYEDIDIRTNPFDAAAGAALKYGAGALRGVEKSAGLGIPSAALAESMVREPMEPGMRASQATRPRQSTPQADQAAKRFVQDEVRDAESASPGAVLAGEIAGYALPISPVNAGTNAALKATNYAGRNPLVKTAIASQIGGAGAVTEGAIQDVTSPESMDWANAIDNAKTRYLYGAGLGAAGDIVSQAAGGIVNAQKTSPRFQDVRNLQRAGGDTHVLKGVTVPKNIQENINKAAAGQVPISAQDYAATKVAPQVQVNLESKARAGASKAKEALDRYRNSPDGLKEHSLGPVVKNVLKFADAPGFKGQLSGGSVPANAKAMQTIRKELENIGEVTHMTPAEFAEFQKSNPDSFQLNSNQSGNLGIKTEQGKVPVVVARKGNAGAVLDAEERLAADLRFATKEVGADNPVLKEINKAFKEVRDKFEYYPNEASVAPTEIATEPPTPTSNRQPVKTDTIPAPRPVAKAGARSIAREATPSQYAVGAEDPNIGNRRAFVELLPEAKASLDELEYDKHLEGMKKDNARSSSLQNEFSEYVAPPQNYPERSESPNRAFAKRSDSSLKEYAEDEAKIKAHSDSEAKRIALEKKARELGISPEELQKISDSESFIDVGDDQLEELPDSVPPAQQRQTQPVPYTKKSPKELYGEGSTQADIDFPNESIHPIIRKGKKFKVENKRANTEGGFEYELSEETAQKPTTPNIRPKAHIEPEVPEYESISEDIAPDSFMKDFVPPDIKSKMGLESQLDAQLLTRDIQDQIRIEQRAQAKNRGQQLRATLDDGTEVQGLSALQRQHHLENNALEDATSLTGANNPVNIHRRVVGYGTTPGNMHQDQELFNQAQELGLERELAEVAGTRVAPALQARSFGLAGQGPLNALMDATAFRLNPILGAVSDQPYPNPFAPPASSPSERIRQYGIEAARRLLNQQGGITGARYGGDLAEIDPLKVKRY